LNFPENIITRGTYNGIKNRTYILYILKEIYIDGYEIEEEISLNFLNLFDVLEVKKNDDKKKITYVM